jgi:hypothetical protein
MENGEFFALDEEREQRLKGGAMHAELSMKRPAEEGTSADEDDSEEARAMEASPVPLCAKGSSRLRAGSADEDVN